MSLITKLSWGKYTNAVSKSWLDSTHTVDVCSVSDFSNPCEI